MYAAGSEFSFNIFRTSQDWTYNASTYDVGTNYYIGGITIHKTAGNYTPPYTSAD